MIGLFVLLGILFRRIKAFPNETAQVLNMFALYVSLPAVILLKAPELTLSTQNIVAAIVPWCMLLLSATIILLLSKQCNWSRPTIGVLLLVVPLGACVIGVHQRIGPLLYLGIVTLWVGLIRVFVDVFEDTIAVFIASIVLGLVFIGGAIAWERLHARASLPESDDPG